MTRNWFTCVVKYVRHGADGSEEKTTDQLLLDAYTYTEAEARLVGIVTDVCTGPFEVQSITKSNYAEVVRWDTGDKWFRVKVALTSFDERSGKEKESNQFFLFSADDVKDAFDKTKEFLKGSGIGFVIPAINYTKISEIYPQSEEGSTNMTAADGYGAVPADHPSIAQPSAEETVPAGVDPETGEVS